MVYPREKVAAHIDQEGTITTDLLQNVHSNIVQQKRRQKHPLMNEGAGGVDAGIARFLVAPLFRRSSV